jgi:hypothetical protein
MGFVASVCQPSTLRMLIWPDASNAQNSIAAVSADGSYPGIGIFGVSNRWLSGFND